MPDHIDPCWEYRVIPEEIEEAGVFPRESGFAALGLEDLRVTGRGALVGFRFGSGADGLRWKGFRYRRGRCDTFKDRPPLTTCAGCGKLWNPDRPDRKYCSADCVVHKGGVRVRPLVQTCPGCRTEFEPPCGRTTQVYCSRRCAGRSAAAVRPPGPDPTRVVELYMSGMSAKAVGLVLCVSHGTVRAVLRGAGVTIRPQGRPKRNNFGSTQ